MSHDFDDALHQLRRTVRQLRTGGVEKLRAARALPYSLWTCFMAMRQLPEVRVALPASQPGREIGEALDRRVHRVRNRRAAGVLELRADVAYTAGRSRQAVRTNATRARKAGLASHRLDGEGTRAAVDAVLPDGRQRKQYRRWLFERIEDKRGEFWAVLDVEEAVHAMLVITVAGDVAFLNWMLSAPSDDRSAARYLLSADVFQALADRGVRRVITGTAFGMSEGLVYFQRRLGFTPCNVRTSENRALPS